MKRLALILALVAALFALDVAPASAGGCVLRQPGAGDVMKCGPAEFDSITTSGTLTTTGTLSAEQLTSTDDATITDDVNVGGTVIIDQDAVSDHVAIQTTGTSIDALAVDFAGTYSVTAFGGANFAVLQTTGGANISFSGTDDGTLATAGGSITAATKANTAGLGYGVQLLTAPSGYSDNTATGGIALLTGAQTGTADTGTISFTTGNATSNNSGDITLATGTAGGTRGDVTISALNLGITAKVNSAGTAPTPSSCGTTPSIVGSDTAGKVTVGSSASAVDGCVLTFATAYANAPVCQVIGDDSAMNLAATTSTTALTITSTAAGDPSGDVWMYLCVGQDGD